MTVLGNWLERATRGYRTNRRRRSGVRSGIITSRRARPPSRRARASVVQSLSCFPASYLIATALGGEAMPPSTCSGTETSRNS
jgi:hypothetical protein